MKPQISIIIPTFNRGYILEETLASVQQQTFTDWELHIIDDGSTDKTKSIVNLFKADTRIHYHYQQNQGVAVARNHGMEKAQGDIFTFIDSDDPVYPYYLEKGLYYLNQNKTFALSHCDFFYELYDREGMLLSRKSAEKEQCLKVGLENIYNWDVRLAIGTGLFFKAKYFQGKVSWRKDIVPGDDIEFVMQLAVLSPDGFIYIPEPLFEYRQKYGGDGICSNTTYHQWADMFAKIYELHKNDPLMVKPEEYIRRIHKYSQLQKDLERGEALPPQFKYFPEFYLKK